jgi:hypothetical protein
MTAVPGSFLGPVTRDPYQTAGGCFMDFPTGKALPSWLQERYVIAQSVAFYRDQGLCPESICSAISNWLQEGLEYFLGFHLYELYLRNAFLGIRHGWEVVIEIPVMVLVYDEDTGPKKADTRGSSMFH